MSNVKKKFQGRSAYRYKDNPIEKAFALEWQEQNDTSRAGMKYSHMDYLFDKENKGSPNPPLTERDWEVANTVIQWLGSPVGRVFLCEVLKGYEMPFRNFRQELQIAAEGRR